MKAWEVLYLVICMMENKALKDVWRKGLKGNRKRRKRLVQDERITGLHSHSR